MPGWVLLELQSVVQTDGDHQSRNLVVAVRPLGQHFEEQVDFSRRPDHHRVGVSFAEHGEEGRKGLVPHPWVFS